MADLEESLMAYPAIRRLRALLPGGWEAVADSVRRALEHDDYSRALKLANERYANKGPGDYAAVMTYACLLVGRELVDEAQNLIGKAIDTHGDDPALRALLADALVLAGQVDDARAQLARIDLDAVERAQVASFVADVWLDVGDEDAAIAFYQHAVDRGVDDAEPAIRLGQLLEGRDELWPAAQAFDYAARLAKDRAGLWKLSAELWFDVGEQRRGLVARQRLFEIAHADADEWLVLGFELAQIGEFDRALEALGEAIDLDPFAADALLVRGNVLLELGRPEEALAAFKRVEEFRGEHAGARRGMAEAALLIGDLGLAEARINDALSLTPDDPEVHFIHGRVLQQYGRHQKAIDAFDQALADAPEQPDYASAKALSLAKLGQIDEARVVLEEAVQNVRAHPEQRPVQLDLDGWQRLGGRLDAEHRGWFEAQINFLGGLASQ